MRPSSRPGYVYAMTNHSLPGWHKVGHTHRPPHRRARELSRTAVPTAFEVAFARFFWDAPAAERAVHAALSHRLGPTSRRKEFFQAPLEKVQATIAGLNDAGRPPRDGFDLGDAWEQTLEGREVLWEWAEADWGSEDRLKRKEGWRQMERLSAGGWAEGSWRLAEHLMRLSPNSIGAERAGWVLDAAHAQGMAEAAFRAAWLRSWASPEAFAAWHRALLSAHARHGADPMDWPRRLAETLEADLGLWERCPERRFDDPWLQVWKARAEGGVTPAGPSPR